MIVDHSHNVWFLCNPRPYFSILKPLVPAFQLYQHSESHRLQQDLEKVQQLEGKITGELSALKEQIVTMKAELLTYCDLDTLKSTAEKKKKVRVPSLCLFMYLVYKGQAF